jgi:hypothetical protein
MHVFLLAAAALMSMPHIASAQGRVGDALPFGRAYTITGDVYVGTADVTAADVRVCAAGKCYVDKTINVPSTGPGAIPYDADIIAAFVYTEITSAPANVIADVNQVRFYPAGTTPPGTSHPTNNKPILLRRSSRSLAGTEGKCWATNTTMTGWRTDILRLLPVRIAKTAQTGQVTAKTA